MCVLPLQVKSNLLSLRIIRGNSLKNTRDETVGAVRAVQGLLSGLLRCGRCGRKLHVCYWGKSGTAARYGDDEIAQVPNTHL